MTTEAGVDLLFREAEKRLGRPDVVVVNATCDQPHKPIEEYDWDFYQAMLDFFVKSPFLLTRRALLRTLTAVSIASIAAGSYAVAIEPRMRLVVSRYTLTPPRWPEGKGSLRIADPTVPPGLFEAVVGGVAGIFFGS